MSPIHPRCLSKKERIKCIRKCDEYDKACEIKCIANTDTKLTCDEIAKHNKKFEIINKLCP